jgi:hypothetical protein
MKSFRVMLIVWAFAIPALAQETAISTNEAPPPVATFPASAAMITRR